MKICVSAVQKLAKKIGNAGGLISRSGNGAQSAKITRRIKMLGIIFRMITLAVALIVGAKMGYLGSVIANVDSVFRWRFGMGGILF
jgi:hypothetical protein